MHIWRISPHASFMVRLARFKFAIEGSNTKNVAYQFILTKIGGNYCRSHFLCYCCRSQAVNQDAAARPAQLIKALTNTTGKTYEQVTSVNIVTQVRHLCLFGATCCILPQVFIQNSHTITESGALAPTYEQVTSVNIVTQVRHRCPPIHPSLSPIMHSYITVGSR